jgi:peptidoglycan/LPS O-acetylase OafA/YrhL
MTLIILTAVIAFGTIALIVFAWPSYRLGRMELRQRRRAARQHGPRRGWRPDIDARFRLKIKWR